MRGSLKSFSNHIEPEKEQQLKRLKLEIEDQVKRTLTITNNINHGNKERNLRKKSEAIQLIEGFQKQYESLYTLYEDLREEVKKTVVGGGGDDNTPSTSDSLYEDLREKVKINVAGGGDNTSSTSDSDSESHYSPSELNARNNTKSSSSSTVSDSDDQESETSDFEDTILKDKLTSSSEVKINMKADSESASRKPPDSENTSQMLAQIKDLEGQVATLKLEISTLCKQKRDLEEQVECKSDEAMQLKETISKLEAQILEMQATSKEKENDEQHYSSRISELMVQVDEMHPELNTVKHHKGEKEEQLSHETYQSSSQVKSLMEQVNSLQQELATVNSQNAELELELKKKSEEKSECLLQIEAMRNDSMEQCPAQEKESLKVLVNDLELEKEKLCGEISELQRTLSKKENELTNEQKQFKDHQNIMSLNIKSLTEEVEHVKSNLENLQKDRECLQEELEALQNDHKVLQEEFEKEKAESSLNKSHLEKMSRSNFQLVERKVEELAAEFRKQFEDQCRILSRRIQVAEQLQVENREWYQKTREAYEQENRNFKENADRTEIELKNIKDMTLTANYLLTSVDTQALKFEDCTANFLNRISKASCELRFAKDWAMRKNKELLDVKENLDCSLAQLDDKEAEILAVKEKVWKSEHRVRELEKLIKEREEGMLALEEEKREAIRQLCVWIDYHRGRSDFYKKILSEMNTGRRKAS